MTKPIYLVEHQGLRARFFIETPPWDMFCLGCSMLPCLCRLPSCLFFPATRYL